MLKTDIRNKNEELFTNLMIEKIESLSENWHQPGQILIHLDSLKTYQVGNIMESMQCYCICYVKSIVIRCLYS
jgi:hypothetical protein